MSRNNTKIRKREIRKLWILNALLDCNQWSQKDIKKSWYLMGLRDLYSKYIDAIRGINITEEVKNKSMEKLLKKYKKYVKNASMIGVPKNEEEKIKEDFKKYTIELTFRQLDKSKKTFKEISKQCSSDISNIMKELKNEEIVKDEIITKKVAPKHARPIESVYTLVENYDVLYLILDEINNPITPIEFKNLLLEDLMGSEFLKRVVNKDLVKTIEEKLHLSLDDNDKKLLLFCLGRYSTVIYNTLKEINKPKQMLNENTPLHVIFDPRKHTNGFMLDIKNWAYNDMKLDHYSVDFEITVKIKDDNGKIIKHTNSNIIDDPIEKEDMVNRELEWMEMWSKEKEQELDYFKHEIKDETIFIKDNGEKIDFQYLHIPSKKVSPF